MDTKVLAILAVTIIMTHIAICMAVGHIEETSFKPFKIT